MAIDVEALIMDALVKLVEHDGIALERLTVRQLLDASGVGRQTFYNHFRDKQDLVQRFYDRRIVCEFDLDSGEVADFRSALLASYERVREHGELMRQAILIGGQNNLRDYLFEHSRTFDLAWHQKLWGEGPMSDELRFATDYHALAATSMAISWILSGFPVPAAELVELTCSMRALGMASLFAGATGRGNPYDS